MKIIFAIILTCFCITAIKADDERILTGAKINGKTVRLAIDTGLSLHITLYSTTVKRLGIKYTQPKNDQPVQGNLSFGLTEPCKLEMYNLDMNTFSYGTNDAEMSYAGEFRIPVIEMSSNVIFPEDGDLGWRGIKHEIFSIDAIACKIFYGAHGLLDGGKWETFQLETNLGVLALDIPLGKGTNGIMKLDTGSIFGVSLNSQEWSEWKIAHTNQPSTFVNFYSPSIGEVLREESWADKLGLGPLRLTDVPVMEASSNEQATGFLPQTQYVATLGLAALRRLDVIVDGQNSLVFMRPKASPPLPYQHNRLGANFVRQNSRSNDFIAHVVNGSPAYEAGIRDGDILCSVNKSDVATKRKLAFFSFLSVTESDSPSDVVEYPAGTKLEFSLKRGDKIFKTTAILQNIIPPDAPMNSN